MNNELKESYTDTEKQDKNDYLIENRQIEDTPFNAHKDRDGHWMATLGRYAITQKFDTAEEVIEDLKNVTWTKLMQVMAVAIEHHREMKEIEKQIKEGKNEKS